MVNSTTPPIQRRRSWFIPSQLDQSIILEAENFIRPIRILVRDYSNDLAIEKTGYITITQQ